MKGTKGREVKRVKAFETKIDLYTTEIKGTDMNGTWSFLIAGKGSEEPQIKLSSQFVHEDGTVVINCSLKQLKEIRRHLGYLINDMKFFEE